MGSSLGLDTGESVQEHWVQMVPYREVSFSETVALREVVNLSQVNWDQFLKKISSITYTTSIYLKTLTMSVLWFESEEVLERFCQLSTGPEYWEKARIHRDLSNIGIAGI